MSAAAGRSNFQATMAPLPLTGSCEIDQLVGELARVIEEELETTGDTGGITSRALFHSGPALSLKREIAAVGRKLWDRHYVDGAGGNISARVGNDYVLCTPTMRSKADVEPDDICMVDLAGNVIEGHLPRTSEILLHLEIYKANPAAMAVVHCHPPHATAYAVAGVEPPAGYLVEQELFVGPVPVARYETPGGAAFATTILPFVHSHNTVLLANHGVVCWAETPMRAEWLVEIIDTYCRTLILASQLGKPLVPIPPEKIAELLVIKRRLGIPDPRMENPAPAFGDTAAASARRISRGEIETIIRITLSRIAGSRTVDQ